MNPRERHYDVFTLATAWHVDDETIRRLFRDEPGVLVISRQTSNHERPKTKSRQPRIFRYLRIPHSVAVRVYNRLTRGGIFNPPNDYSLHCNAGIHESCSGKSDDHDCRCRCHRRQRRQKNGGQQ